MMETNPIYEVLSFMGKNYHGTSLSDARSTAKQNKDEKHIQVITVNNLPVHSDEFISGISEPQKGKYDLTDDGKGKKYDGGKPMVGTLCTIFASALLGIGKCIEFGATKYPKSDNWKLVENGQQRYLDSMIRHLLKFLAGQELDTETGLPHLYHVCWNALAVTEFYIMNNQERKNDLLE